MAGAPFRLQLNVVSARREGRWVIVRWPRSGTVQKFQNVAGNRIVQVTEGSDGLVEKKYVRQ